LQNVKSAYIINSIFNHMKNRRKFNIIKYNKLMINRLNITKNDFEKYNILKEFNMKYRKNIKEIDIKALYLSRINIVNENFEFLTKVEFNDLIIINISKNKISDINKLENINCESLKELNLSDN